ncbi:MAG: hypothetical protein Q8O67_23245 [Deltaproteobacteria bacterium]|nr:hypothetical protein [Deltaproteobacteria bacterium]
MRSVGSSTLLSILFALSGCDACVEPGIIDGTEDERGEGSEGEGESSEGEGESSEGEGEGEGEEGEGEGEGEGEEGEGEGEGDDGHGSGDVFVEIDYSSATDPERPAFLFSDTPGFGPAQWAYNDPFGSGATTPDAWDRFQTLEVINDFRLGRVLVIGTGNQELQLMLGLPANVSYERVLVEVDGDEEAHSGVVNYDVYNPLVNCGVSGVQTDGIGRHTKVLDLEDCLIPGEAVQAIRVDPQSGALGLKRLRVTLEGAVW